MESTVRPRVGISRCLLGDLVRYDGGHRRDETLVALSDRVEWVPVCPEAEVGMGTPREAIHLVDAGDGVSSGAQTVRLLGVSSRTDWTNQMASFARRRVQELASQGLCGFVLKSRSPSCGPSGVAVAEAEAGATGTGLFAQALFEVLPDLPVEDEERLRDPGIRDRFLCAVRLRAGGPIAPAE